MEQSLQMYIPQPLPNKQAVEKQDLIDDGHLDIIGTFLTVQGEGPFAGVPAVFVRTSGCNLSGPVCPNCDTLYTGPARHLISPESLLSEVHSRAGKAHLVVITGGEPFRQNLSPFVRLLLDNGFQVQIETNGTLHLDEFPYDEVTIVCSPKTKEISGRLKPWIKHLKYVVDHKNVDPNDGLPTSSLGARTPPCRPWEFFSGQVWVQSCDVQDPEENKLNMRAAVKSCLEHGFRYTSQIHKGLGLP